jgi:hypothetical protein
MCSTYDIDNVEYISQSVTIVEDPRTYSLNGTYWYTHGTTIGEQTEHACVHGFLAAGNVRRQPPPFSGLVLLLASSYLLLASSHMLIAPS